MSKTNTFQVREGDPIFHGATREVIAHFDVNMELRMPEFTWCVTDTRPLRDPGAFDMQMVTDTYSATLALPLADKTYWAFHGPQDEKALARAFGHKFFRRRRHERILECPRCLMAAPASSFTERR